MCGQVLVVRRREELVEVVFGGYRHNLMMVFPGADFHADQPARKGCLTEVA